MLNKTNIKNMKQRGVTSHFNCWGATRHALGTLRYPRWEDETTMRNFLKNYFKKVDGKLEKGDVLAMYTSYGELIYTAIYVGGGKWYHKRGANYSEYTSKAEVIEDYIYYCGKNPVINVLRFQKHRYKGILYS